MAKAKGKGRGRAAAKLAGTKPSGRKSKDDTVDVNSGVQLLLNSMPSDKDALHRWNTLTDLMAKSRRAAKLLANEKQSMKEANFDVAAFETAIKMEKWDPQDVAKYLSEQQRLLAMRGMPVQMELRETRYESVAQQAGVEGRQLGLACKSPNTQRYPEGSDGYEPHMEGWNEGQKEVVKAGGKKFDPGAPTKEKGREEDE